MKIYYFYKQFYTQKDTISKTCGDVDNPNKVLIDRIFERIGWDDYVLGRLECEKLPSPTGEDRVVIFLDKYKVSHSVKDLEQELLNYLERIGVNH